jgi:K+-transporting ATPase ATPase C chain
MKTLIRPALVMFALLTLVTGIVYPALTTVVARIAFPEQAAGSLAKKDGQVVGSRLIGQSFADAKYFWGRPSATSPMAYNGANSGGSNLGPTNPALTDAVKARIDALKAADPQNTAPVPVDLVTASGSGLDPEISVAAARYQAGRVARARGMAPETVRRLIDARATGRLLGLLGEPRVNVLELNLALDQAGAAR